MIPLLIGSGILGVLGIAGHSAAKDTNKKAEDISYQARKTFNAAKDELATAHMHMQSSLAMLGEKRRAAIDVIVQQFMPAYEAVKNNRLTLPKSVGEIANFSMDSQQLLDIQQMSDIYSDVIASGATTAVASAAIALAVNGSLPIVTGTLSIAGSTLALGEVGAAVGLAGSALQFGAAMTPLGAILGPVTFVTALSSSFKADENLEKAEAFRAEALAKVEEMKAPTTLYQNIEKKADLFCDVLTDMTKVFDAFVKQMDIIVQNKKDWYTGRVAPDDLMDEETKILAVTCSLASAVKILIDVPMLSSDGKITDQFQKTYDNMRNKTLPSAREQQRLLL